MNRESVRANVFQAVDTHRGVALELATGYGKTAQALEAIKHLKCVFKQEEYKVLIVVDRQVHIVSWLAEIKRWGGLPESYKVDMVCYASLKKYKNKRYDFIIYDECHHLFTDARMEIFSTIFAKRFVFLSATIQKDFKKFLLKNDIRFVVCNITEAIDEGVLPKPRIIKIPMVLGTQPTEVIIKHPKSDLPPITCEYKDMFTVQKKYPNPIHIKCTPKQYYNYVCNMMDFYKRKHMEPQQLRMGSERLKWLSEQREGYTLQLLKDLKGYRTLTFCSSIAQTERLGKNCINSKNKKSDAILTDFNAKKIKHITSCNVLNEGVNLAECRIGIFGNYNASEKIGVQRVGRLLRHKHPILLLPYFKGTREEEIVNEMLKNYDKELIETAKNGIFKI